MKPGVLFLLVAVMPAPSQIATSTASTAAKTPEVAIRPNKGIVVTRETFDGLERRFDTGFEKIGEPDTPIELLGNTRGVYLEGFGAVFTSELSLVATQGPSPFLMTIPKELITRAHQRKLERLPALRKAMKEMIRIAGLTLVQVPENQQIVMVVRLDYRKWEITSGLPGQILMRTDRKSAMLGEITITEEQ